MRFFFERYYNSECQVTNRLIFFLDKQYFYSDEFLEEANIVNLIFRL